MMIASTSRSSLRNSPFLVLVLSAICGSAFAQTLIAPSVPLVPLSPATAQSLARTDVPDGAPELSSEKTVSNTSSTAADKAPASVIVEEERVQGRLANAHVRVGGAKGYTVVDPNAGRTDRHADNGGKRVSPSLWELFRF
jgi:hypothetical protein